jgi:hypothetical protein
MNETYFSTQGTSGRPSLNGLVSRRNGASVSWVRAAEAEKQDTRRQQKTRGRSRAWPHGFFAATFKKSNTSSTRRGSRRYGVPLPS